VEISVKLSILMPVYNEEERIAAALKQALAVDYPCEIELVVVDDGSRDGTGEILGCADDARLRVITHQRNAGKGAAIKTAVDSAEGEYMVILDADLEYDPQDIPKLLDPVLDGRATVVYGNRTFGSHSAYSFWYVMGNKGVTMAAGRALPLAGDPLPRLRHGGRGDRQAAAPAHPPVRGADQLPGPRPRGGQEDHLEGRRRGDLDPRPGARPPPSRRFSPALTPGRR
jgi:hypothetical protein